VFTAERDGEMVGWLAFYRLVDASLAHVWDWHPAVVGRSDEASLPDGYSLGHISETDLDRLYVCWTAIFAASSDQVFHSSLSGEIK
jgi:hypothetical protein